MHELFTKVLSRRDLSRAGDLFSVADAQIVDDLTDVLAEIDTICSQPDYQHNTNDQSVVEICVTRVLSCIRETKTAERHCSALVALLNTCLQHNLKPTTTHKVDPPHAKISADIISSIFLNYNKKPVMQIALPVAVKFLQKGNAELSRNLASYLSLAAIEYASLLSPHVQPILDSICADANYGLCRLLSQLYEIAPDRLSAGVAPLVLLLPRCEVADRLALLQLFALIARQRPVALVASVPQLCAHLEATSTALATMQVLLPLAQLSPAAAELLCEQFARLRAAAAQESPAMVQLAAQIMAAAGKINKDKAQIALDFVLEHLPHADRSAQTAFLHEATMLCSTYPILFNEKVLACVRQRNQPNSTAAIHPASPAPHSNGLSANAAKSAGASAGNKPSTIPKSLSEVNKTSGGITIVKLNAAPASPLADANNVSASHDHRPSAHTTHTLGKSKPLANGHQQHSGRSQSHAEAAAAATAAASASASAHVVTIHTTASSVQVTSSAAAHHPPPAAAATSSAAAGTGHQHEQHQHLNHHHQHPSISASRTTASSNSTSTPPTASASTSNGGYTRRAKLGDSRSTGRLHSAGNTHRSMTRLNIAGGSVGGLHKSMTRLSSSQQINNQQAAAAAAATAAATTAAAAAHSHQPPHSNSGHSLHASHSGPTFHAPSATAAHFTNGGSSSSYPAPPLPLPLPSHHHDSNYVTPVPPLSSNVIITGHNRWGIPSTKITSGGVTVTTATSPQMPHAAGGGVSGGGGGGGGGVGGVARVRPHSQGPTTLGMGSTGALGVAGHKLSGSALNQSTGSIGMQQMSPPHSPPAHLHLQQQQPLQHPAAGGGGSSGVQTHHISVHHATPAAAAIGGGFNSPPALQPAQPHSHILQHQLSQSSQKSVMTLPVNSGFLSAAAVAAAASASASSSSSAAAATTVQSPSGEVIVCGPLTVTSRRNNDNTSVTLLNHSTSGGGGGGNSIINQRMSTFEPYQIMRDTVQQFCEKHFASIKEYMDKLSHRLPPPTRCGIEERRTKKVAKLHFACQIRGPHCLYSKTCFTMRTRNPKTWIHLMFLDFQIRNYVKDNCALSTREPGISNLKNMWNMIRTENKSFTELVTSNFPSLKEQEALVNELRHSGFLDVFEVSRTDRSTPNANELEFQWGCFLCNHPEKAVGFLHGTNQPMIEGQLKEKKGKWRLFRRWRTRYFTLSGAHLSCKGSSGGESIDVNQIRSVKVSRGARNIPKAFEIFTGDQTLILKPKDGKNAEEWVQCLSIVVAHSQARDNPMAKTNSLPARGLGNSRTAF